MSNASSQGTRRRDVSSYRELAGSFLVCLSCRPYISTNSFAVVASSGPLSSRQRPVNRGNRIARPAPGRRTPHAQVWIGLTVISAPLTSRTVFGSNQTSGSSFESTRAGRRSRRSPLNRSGSAYSVSSSKPVPSLHVVRKTSATSSYAAMSRAPYVPARFPRPANAPITTRSIVSLSAALYSFLNLIHWYPRPPASYVESSAFAISPSHPAWRASSKNASACFTLSVTRTVEGRISSFAWTTPSRAFRRSVYGRAVKSSSERRRQSNAKRVTGNSFDILSTSVLRPRRRLTSWNGRNSPVFGSTGTASPST